MYLGEQKLNEVFSSISSVSILQDSEIKGGNMSVYHQHIKHYSHFYVTSNSIFSICSSFHIKSFLVNDHGFCGIYTSLKKNVFCLFFTLQIKTQNFLGKNPTPHYNVNIVAAFGVKDIFLLKFHNDIGGDLQQLFISTWKIIKQKELFLNSLIKSMHQNTLTTISQQFRNLM